MPISDPVASALQQRVSSRVAEVRDRMSAAVARGGHGQSVTLVAVTKTHGPEIVEAVWQAGVTDVGENRVQEAEGKMALVSAPVRWHLIGHLQRNKAKAALNFALVHGVDSDRLAEALNSAAAAAGTTLDILVQVNISGEDTKSGLSLSDVPALADRLHHCQALRVMGAMTMAPFEAAEATLRQVFAGARDARAQLQAAGHAAPWLSMGMSGDYEIGIEEGATHVRVGSALFGDRG